MSANPWEDMPDEEREPEPQDDPRETYEWDRECLTANEIEQQNEAHHE